VRPSAIPAAFGDGVRLTLASFCFQGARILLAAEKWRQAVALLKIAIRLRNDRASWHYRLGLALQKSGQLEAAIKAYEAAVARDGGHAEWHYQLGRALAKSDQWEKAATAFEDALARGDSADRHYQLGRAYERLGRWEKAASEYDAALTREPVGALAQDGIARVCRRAQQSSAGREDGQIARQRRPSKICFSPAHPAMQSLASARIRCLFMAKALNENCGDLTCEIGISDDASAIVVSQLCSTGTLIQLANAKAKGTRIIYDCCDPYADYEGAAYGIYAARRFWDLVALADVITVPTDGMRSLLLELAIAKPVIVIPDSFDYQEQIDRTPVPPTASVVWFGNPGRGNFVAGVWALQALKERWGLSVTLITNPGKISVPPDFQVEPWTYDGFVRRLRRHGLALVSQDRRTSYKSENRYVTSIMNGVPAISTGSQSIAKLLTESGFAEMNVTTESELDAAMKLLGDPDYRANYLSRMQRLVEDRFGPRAVARHFVEQVLQPIISGDPHLVAPRAGTSGDPSARLASSPQFRNCV